MDLVRQAVSQMINLLQSVILNATNSGTLLPEPTALLLMGTLMLIVGNLQRRAFLARTSGRSSDR
jgi:hypothetical protein